MKRLLAPTIIIAAALTLAACGSGDDASTATAGAAGSGTPSSAAASSATTVNVVTVKGVGETLADAQGRVLYTSDEEAADPNVLCADACEGFWKPLVAGSGHPTGAAGVTDLGVAKRPDGTEQVTYGGRRLYTFTRDAPGEASGNGVSDTFGGQHFTWHAVVVGNATGGGTDSPTPTTTSSGGAYGGY